jgi:hypothetical protein
MKKSEHETAKEHKKYLKEQAELDKKTPKKQEVKPKTRPGVIS